MTADPASLVAAGVRLIDKKKPGAVALLDPREVRIASSCDCPLGQVFGSYAKGLKALSLDENGAVQHGFLWPSLGFNSGVSSHDLIAGLEDAWKHVVRDRRALL